MSEKVRVCISMSDDVNRKLDEIAYRDNESRSAIVDRTISRYYDERVRMDWKKEGIE